MRSGAVTAGRSESFPFFFQAEDGIRDLTVTGVQTCALPISSQPTVGSRTPLTGGTAIGATAALEGNDHRFPSAVAYDPAAEIPPPIPPTPPGPFPFGRVISHEWSTHTVEVAPSTCKAYAFVGGS